MYRVVDETTREIISLENARFEAMCPDCGEWFPIDLLTYAAYRNFSFETTKICCMECSDKRREAADHLDLFDYD